jgi:AcrR family transcriptional regulator
VGIDEQAREQAILQAGADLLCRLGYNKLTMGDVADAVALHRGLVYLRFKSKDELVEAVVLRELSRYAEAWREHLVADRRAGSVASVLRAMVLSLKTLPLASAIVARDGAVFGKYLSKPANLFDRLPKSVGTREFLQTMQEAGAVRHDIDARAVAFIIDALVPAIRPMFSTGWAESADADRPSLEELLETLAELLERALTPPGGANLAAGKAALLGGLAQARAGFTAQPAYQEGEMS